MPNPADKDSAIISTEYGTASAFQTAIQSAWNSGLAPWFVIGSVLALNGYATLPTNTFSVIDTTGMSPTAIGNALTSAYPTYPYFVAAVDQYIVLSSVQV